MATQVYYGAPHFTSSMTHSHGHHGRNRRGPRVSAQNHNRHFKAQRSPKEVIPEPPAHTEYVQRLEAAKSFEFDDDEIFCPFHLLTEDDLHSIHSASSSDRGSLSSGSPEGSPLQHQVQPAPALYLSSATNAYGALPPSLHTHHGGNSMKLHQPMAQRTRNAIPIVDPASRSIASPPLSVSPGRQMQQYARRW